MTSIPINPPLTEKESHFVQAIMDGATRTEAARRSCYGNTAGSQRAQGSRLMRRPKIIQAIEEARRSRDEEAPEDVIADREEVLSRLTHLARHGETERIRMDALTTLGRYHSLWSDTLKFEDRELPQRELEAIREAHRRVAALRKVGTLSQN